MITTAALPRPRRTAVRELLARVTAHDGVSPLDEAALLALDGGSAQHLLIEEAGTEVLRGYASVLADGTVQGMVDPAHRRQGHGSALLREALAVRPDAGVWAHGALEGALAMLTAAGLEVTRSLLTLHRDLGPAQELPALPASTPEWLRLDTFVAERDIDRWVEVNALAFAAHPEQGALTRSDLEQRIAQPWFDAEDMHVALRDEELVGFVWVKREAPDGAGADAEDAGAESVGAESVGAEDAGAENDSAQNDSAENDDAEIYVVATDPSVQGHGVAGLLMATALAHLRADGVPGVELYVEADNAPALRLYENWGFTVAGRDVQLRATGRG